MANSEWSLLLFTLLAQTAVGAFLFWELPRIFSSSNLLLRCENSLKPYLIFTGIAILALLISFFHLGNPMHAIYSLSNLKGSWLSREILFASLFTGLMVLVNIMEWRDFKGKDFNRIISAVTILSGLALVYSMAQIYMLSTVPLWNSPSTMLEFFTTTFLLGLVLTVGIGKAKTTRNSAILLLISLPLLLFIKLINLLFITSAISDTGTGELLLLNMIRAIFLLLAAILLVVWLLRKRPPEDFFQGKWYYFLTGLLVISEITGRYLFYAGYVSVGV